MFERFYGIIAASRFRKMLGFMNERTLLANARYTSSIVKELQLLEGSGIRVTRQRSNQGTPQFLRVA